MTSINRTVIYLQHFCLFFDRQISERFCKIFFCTVFTKRLTIKETIGLIVAFVTKLYVGFAVRTGAAHTGQPQIRTSHAVVNQLTHWLSSELPAVPSARLWWDMHHNQPSSQDTTADAGTVEQVPLRTQHCTSRLHSILQSKSCSVAIHFL